MKLWRNQSKARVYADAAAATPLSESAKSELTRLLSLFGNAGSLHQEGMQAKKELDHARGRVASVLGAHADEIIFTASGTEANNLALQGMLRPLLQKQGECGAITSKIEHASILEPLRALEREGLYATELEVDTEGFVEANVLKEAISDETALVSIQFVNSEVGTIERIKEIAKIVRAVRKERKEKNISLPLLFHTDAAQAPLWLSLKVDSLGVDLLSLDAQKIMGPKGVGALYVRRATPLEPILWGGMQERGFRAGTENVPLIGAFAVALDEAQKGVEERAEKIGKVRDNLIAELQKTFPDSVFHGPRGNERVANNVNVSIPGLTGEMGVIALNVEGVAASTRSACDTGEEGPSHVLEALHVSQKTALEAIRFTFLPSATTRDVKTIIEALKRVANIHRNVL